MKTVIVGTAGHIDHGKSELVAALTGVHPDRLREERERGITIDIGFASLPLGSLVLSFVDVPGHERFVKNMLAGATGIDLVLLVIAADESVRPQTREHLAICSLLGLARGVIALTKIDIADPELAALAASEVRDAVKGTFLESAPLVPVSSRTGEGIEDLKAALADAAGALPERDASGPARLPIDRSFTMRGFGTVVTGTLISGAIRAGDELDLLTEGRSVKVRGLQVHGQTVESARAGQRTAVNLQGVSHHEIERGDVLATPRAFEPTSMFDARLVMIAEAPRALADLDRVRVHIGTAEILARLRPLGRNEIPPGEEGYVQLRLERPAVVAPGDRFIIRRYSPASTIGGGWVLDVIPSKHRRSDTDAALALSGLEGSDAAGRARWVVSAQGEKGVPPADLARRVGAPWPTIARSMEAALRERSILALGAGPELLISAEGFAELQSRAVSLLASFHEINPMLPGMPLEEMRGRLCPGLRSEAARALLTELARIAVVKIDRDTASLPGHRVTLGLDEERLASALSELFRDSGLNPPEPADALKQLGGGAQGEKVLAHLTRQGTLRKLRDGRLFHRQALEELVKRLHEYRARSETIDVAAFKDLAGVTRKNAIPLLEHLDEERVTLRRGSHRVILAPSSTAPPTG